MGHQADFCLSPAFTGCPIFQDWASRAAAEPILPRVSVTAVDQRVPGHPAESVMVVGAAATRTATPADRPMDADPRPVTPSGLTRSAAQAADEEFVATRSVPSYRAVPNTGAVASSATVPVSGTVPTTGAVPATGAVASSGAVPSTAARDRPAMDAPGIDTEDDIPVIRSMPVPGRTPAAMPPAEDDWTAPPPWLRQPASPVWIAEAVPPPDALADVGTQPVRRSRPPAAMSVGLAEAAIPAGGPHAFGVPGSFGDETTGMPLDLAVGALASASGPPKVGTNGAPQAGTNGAPQERIIEATGTGTQPADPGVSAELAASRYRADVMAGLATDEEVGVGSGSRASSRTRRVPIDAHASTSLGSQSQARPSARSTGSREWEGPRRFEAYAATQRRRPPTSLLVGGGAIALAVLLLGVFLLPGLLMGGAPAVTATPAPTDQTAAVIATRAPSKRTADPERTARPERTPKLRTYTVRSGDTLIKIAKRFKVTVAKITCLNRIKNPNNVAVGRTLTIPPKGYRCPRDG